MKRIFLSLFVLILTINARASHLMGGDMTASYDNATGDTYIKLSLYRDILGISMPAQVDVDIWKYDNLTSQYVQQNNVSLPYNTSLSTALLPTFPYGIEVGIFTSSVALSPGSYRMIFYQCCRNMAIINAANPGGNAMCLTTDVFIPPTANNSSTPDFLSLPVAYFPVNMPASYNPLPYDNDGDSIAWALITPFDYWTNANASPTVIPGHIPPSAAATGPFTMNAITGEVTWTPNMIGNFIQSFEVKEYRNGAQIGRIIRDMQYVIIVDSNTSANNFVMVTPYKVNNSEHYNYIFYEPGQPFVFEIKGTNSSPNSSLTMTANGGLFLGTNAPSFTTVTNGNEVTGKLEWTPPVGMDKDQVVAFRISDGTFTKDATILLRKDPGPQQVTNTNNTVAQISVFPNPATNVLHVNLGMNLDFDSDIALYNIMGQRVKTIYTGKLPKGQIQLTEDLQLAAGTYQLVIKDKESVVKTLPVVIQ